MGSALLFSENESLRVENESLKAKLEKDGRVVALYEEENSRLHEIIRKLKREAFGPRRERWESQEQILLFNEAETLVRNPEVSPNESPVEVKGFKRKRGKRKPLPANLPREIVVVDLPETEKVAPDGSPLRVIGREVSERLKYQPARVSIIEYHRLKYAGNEGQDIVKVAAAVPSIVPKSIVTPSLLSQIVTAKFADGLPLYRQEEQFERLDVAIPRCTMARWVVKGAEACRGIWNALEERLMTSPYLACDETPTQVLKEKGRAAESKSWMWVRSNPSDEKKIILFDYDPSRAGDVAKRLFLDYEGYLQADGYGGYNAMEKQKGVKRIGCNMHGRRKFYDAGEGSSKGQSLAEEGLTFYQDLYAIEEKAKGLSWDERFNLRLQEAVPLWEKMKTWADTNQPLVPPKSKIGKAFHYFIEQYDYLKGYLQDGRLEMDNGFTERAIKYFAIGRNNWLFSDSEAGAEASSLFYSFVVTAKLNGVNPFEALEKIFTEVPVAKTVEDYERLATYLLEPSSN
jgi:transposase